MTAQRHLVHGCLRRPTDPSKGAGLLMTATLRPPAGAVARADPDDRLGDYLDALRFYLSLPDEVVDRILFVDNSASDLDRLVALASGTEHGKTVEFIGFAGNDHPPERGKAYGEFKLMDHGLANTTLFGADDRVWKTTGRLKFLNLPQMMRAVGRRRFDFVCDLHNVPWVGSGSIAARRYMDLRVFAFRVGAYRQVLGGQWQRHEAGFDAADIYRLMMEARASCEVVPRMPIQPQLQGISGRHLRDYQSSGQQAKDNVRSLCRRVAPWLWL